MGVIVAIGIAARRGRLPRTPFKVKPLAQHAVAKRWFDQTVTEHESVGLAWASDLGFGSGATAKKPD